MILLDGKDIAREIDSDLKTKVNELPGDIPELSILIGTAGGGELAYSRAIVKKAEDVGLSANIYSEEESRGFIDRLRDLSESDSCGAIIVQRPYPEGIEDDDIYQLIPPAKDIDGASYEMMGRLYSDADAFVPATASAIVRILEEYECKFEGANACIVGRSISVGKPVSVLLLQKNSTITICHSRTSNLSAHTGNADILIVAVGVKHFLKEDMVSENAWVVDVGYNYDSEGGPYGDCDFERVSKKVYAITPVPGGVGPVTTITLLENAYKAIKKAIF